MKVDVICQGVHDSFCHEADCSRISMLKLVNIITLLGYKCSKLTTQHLLQQNWFDRGGKLGEGKLIADFVGY
jgi:hypothetical protein